MMRGLIVLGRVGVRRVVAAAYMAADEAQPEVHPATARLQAIFTATRGRCDLTNLIQVAARFIRHRKNSLHA